MAKKRNVTLGLLQFSMSKDQAKNTAKGLRMAKEAARKGAEIICLPELCRTLYFPQKRRLSPAPYAETVPGESTRAFSRLACELGVTIILPLYERAPGGKLYNTAAVIDETGQLLGAYRKMHIPHDPLFWEQDYFRAGNGGFKVFKTRKARFSVLICFDQWFPEAARACALQGAEILFYPTAIGEIRGHRAPEGDWLEAWTLIQRSHAVANSVHVAAVNRVGQEGRLAFWGSSFVADSFGNLRARAPRGKEAVLTVRVDLSANERTREGWGFMRNRRPDAYRALVRGRAHKPRIPAEASLMRGAA
ncbi:MAG: carbon-nitrogen hydrolase [Elusimicrobiota bacterium]|jgi:agmatine deiminase